MLSHVVCKGCGQLIPAVIFDIHVRERNPNQGELFG